MRSTKYTNAIHDRLNLYSATSSIPISGVKPLRKQFPAGQPILAASDNSESITECCPLQVDESGNLVDTQGRKVTLKGINVDGSMKLPTEPDLPSYLGDSSNPNDIFFEGDTVTFVGRPFPVEDAWMHFQRIKSWGYNTVRYLITWEAVEHAGPKKYDQDFVESTIKILKVLHEIGGLYVFIEFHQDVWSRFSGGSGAPMWTLYAAGLEPRRFAVTESAILHNDAKYHRQHHSEKYHKMMWASNYKRLSSLVMFTLFFAGKTYFPKLVLDGENIQDYLQNHYCNAVGYVWKAINEKLPEMVKDGTIIGFESMNEPNMGLVGHDDVRYLPGRQQLRVGTTPTVYQSFRLGMGFACKVDEYKIALTGPQKFATRVIDPKGARVWLSPEEGVVVDKRYGWKRGSSWKLGECIFAQEGIWGWDQSIDFDRLHELSEEKRLDISTARCEVRLPNYFNQVLPEHNHNPFCGLLPKTIDTEYFTNNNFIDYYIKFKKTIRDISADCFLFIQPPVLDIPPSIKSDPRKIIDSKTIYCPHYYDGMSLMFKTWNTKYNVDTLGIMRGRYLNPVLGIVFGERAIRNCIKKQFIEMKKEAQEYLGNIPVLMSETGMPFDMDSKRSYRNGKYISQTAALDALSNALEGSNMSHTYWCYTSINCHEWGDRWNNEDFSFWSPEDRNLSFESETTPQPMSRRGSIVKKVANKSHHIKNKIRCDSKSNKNESPDKESEDDSESESLQDSSLISTTTDNIKYKHYRKCYPSPDGVRAPNAVIRPYVVATKGDIEAVEFDIKSVKYGLSIKINKCDLSLANVPTIIFVPKWHYPYLDYGDIYLTSGYIKYNERLEYIEWYHVDNPNEAEEPDDATLIEGWPTIETIIIKNSSGTLEERAKENSWGSMVEQSCPTT